MNVRRAAPGDGQLLHELAAMTFALACPPGTLQEDIDAFIGDHLSVGHFEAYIADPKREVFVAVSDERFLGYTMLVYGEPTDPDVAAALTTRPTAELSKCYVLADEHGRGISAALMATTLESALSRGMAAVWLGVNEHNARANRFYEKNGFALVGSKKFLVGDEWHDDFTRERAFEGS